MKLMKIMFIIIMMMGTLISISAYSWINIWIGLEMNLMAFLPLMNSDNMKQSSEVSMKYFLVQVSASMFILFSFLFSLTLMGSINELSLLSQFMFNSAIFMKMGAAPFHFWYPSIAEGLSWTNLMILMTWQKIAPMILIMYNFQMNLYFSMIILLSMTISGVKNWNQTSLKKIMALSSINHIGWMTTSMLLNQSLWTLYFIIYMFISINLIFILNKYNINNLKELMMILNLNKSMKMFFFFNFFSLGGIPPFLGFLPKWLILKTLIENNMYMLAFIMIFTTMLTLYIYMRIIIQPLILKIKEKKMFFKNYETFYINLMNWINIIGLMTFTILLVH
uniref:NADH dehydrogenase subunit 2 n=1 Tax=Vibidia duodecimguttata TaxID=420103 RepID=UPI0021B50CF4|nr:NADH dehydrogenase subunit 2 [Vibidia duodecimguttata]UVU20926.1 NADH dehydrogenase subunit 2 [Vibidia duodecimguttata]